jgi:hypothetical protein
MRKGFALVFLLMLVSAILIPYGCTDKKPEPVDTTQVDSIVADTTEVDSTEDVIAETPMPKAADELFDDFIFNFAANRKLQQSRIAFPLPVYHDGKLEQKLVKRQWQMERFFMRQGYYTLILDNHKQMDLVKDTAVNHVAIEKIYLKKETVQTYSFDKINGEWKLTAVHYQPLAKNRNANFLKFYNHFSTDSAFQVQSMAGEVEFTAPDPEDDFSTISGVIVPQQWFDFRPGIIPSGLLYNILYGRKRENSDYRILVIRGIANGLEMEMNFRRIGGHWKLIEFNS